MFLEESLTFGVLGETGKGATEHFGIPVSLSALVRAVFLSVRLGSLVPRLHSPAFSQCVGKI